MRAAALCAALLLAAPALASDETPADPRLVFQTAVERLTEQAPDLRTVEVLGFAGRGGHSLCADALTEALLAALDEEARNPNRAIRERPLTIRRRGAGASTTDGVAAIASGQFDTDQAGRAYLSVTFRREAAIIAPSGRVRVALDKMGCDATPRPFLEHVSAGARPDPEKLDVSAPVFAIGQRLEVVITLGAPARLHCWVLAPDGTAYVTLPTAAAAAISQPGRLRYPRDFRLEDVVLNARFENLFACFGAAEPLPEALAEAWVRHGREATLVDAATVQALLAEMRATPGVSEALTRIAVR
ncbi:MAG: hypothetical protein ACRCTI_18105 [Beijerinckiaceae bacterium]